MGVEFDPYSHEFQDDPYPAYRVLRDTAPVHHSPASDTWVVSRHADVQRVLTAPEIFSSDAYRRRRGVAAGAFTQLKTLATLMRRMRVGPRTLVGSRMLIMADGKTHAAMRDIVNRGFTPRRVSAWEARIRELASEGLGRMRSRSEFDLMQELAIPLPVTVIAELLGVESQHRERFKAWSDALVEGGTGSGMGIGNAEVLEAMCGLRDYLRPIVRQRRAAPQDDLISVLVQASGPAALSDYEIFMFVLLLLVAGNETTTNLIGNTVDALLDHPDQLERVVREPALIPGLVEEVLRFDSPIQFALRVAREEFEIAGTRIPRGAQVAVLLGSANRDERAFSEPDRFDVARDTRGHLAFGFGPHFCLGASLARLEARCALEVLVPELPRLQRLRPEREFLDSFQVRGRTRLELRAA